MSEHVHVLEAEGNGDCLVSEDYATAAMSGLWIAKSRTFSLSLCLLVCVCVCVCVCARVCARPQRQSPLKDCNYQNGKSHYIHGHTHAFVSVLSALLCVGCV